MAAETLRLRPLRRGDEAPLRRAHTAMAREGFTFGLGYDPGMAFDRYLDLLERDRRGVDLPAGRVPATFLVADVDGVLVGRASIRHRLNDFLRTEGGHIGYGVLPEHRRRGHATAILRQSLGIAAGHGIDRALVTCDDDNVASATVIERCGGVLASRVTGESGTCIRRYWVPCPESRPPAGSSGR